MVHSGGNTTVRFLAPPSEGSASPTNPVPPATIIAFGGDSGKQAGGGGVGGNVSYSGGFFSSFISVGAPGGAGSTTLSASGESGVNMFSTTGLGGAGGSVSNGFGGGGGGGDYNTIGGAGGSDSSSYNGASPTIALGVYQTTRWCRWRW